MAPQINLGDLVRAFARLRPTGDATRGAIAELLGWSLTFGDSPPVDDGVSGAPPSPPADQHSAPSAPIAVAAVRSAHHSDTGTAAAGVPLTPRRPAGVAAQVDAILQGTALPTQEPVALDTMPPPSLFDPVTLRSILFFALATVAHEGHIDVDALARCLAFQDRWDGRIPRLPRATLRRGVQVMIDRRSSMSPFYGDQNTLFQDICNVVGAELVAAMTFQATPSMVLPHDTLLPRPYRAPPPGTPVLLLSDLGLGRAGAGDVVAMDVWLDFARRLRKASCPIVAFVPYPARRWPRALARHLIMIQWDRPVTPGHVRRRIGLGHEVHR